MAGRSSTSIRPICRRFVPHLHAALDACDGMWVNVEIKNDPHEPDFDPTDSIADHTMATLRERGDDDRWLISSFRLETIDRCRALEGSIRTAWLVDAVPDDVISTMVARGHAALHPWVATLRRSHIDVCHGAGIVVNTWTCDDPQRMVELDRVGHRRDLHQRPRCGDRGDGRPVRASGRLTGEAGSPRSGDARNVAPASRRGSRRRAGTGTVGPRSRRGTTGRSARRRVLDDFMPPPRNAPPRACRTAPTFSVLNVIATRPRSNVAAGLRSSGRLPRYVYGLVLSTIVK